MKFFSWRLCVLALWRYKETPTTGRAGLWLCFIILTAAELSVEKR